MADSHAKIPVMPKLYMGLFCHGSHDSAVALVDTSGRALYAAEQERFDRRKHSSRFPEEAIRSALRETGARWTDVAAVGFAWDPLADLDRIAFYLLKNVPSAVPILFRPKQKTESRLKKWLSMREVPAKLRSLGWTGTNYRQWNHHLCHAASTYFSSGFPSAACLTVDGNGEFASTTLHSCHDGRFTALERVDYPHSLGHFYATITQYLGFKPLNDEYKVMGLAAFGRANADQWRRQIDKILLDQEGFRLDLKYFQFYRGRDRMWSTELETLLGPPRKPGTALEARHEGIAAAAQDALERAMLRLSSRAREKTGLDRLCLAGGVALNCVANERLFREGGWREIFILPAPHDSGSALGAAHLARFADSEVSAIAPPLASAALGPTLRAEQAPEGPWKSRPLQGQGIGFLAKSLADGKTVAWARGRSEFGPRALGQRSLLADPRNAANKERLNAVIKRRESFRPFAPVVPLERADEIFNLGGQASPFMLRTVPVREGWAARIPAAIHVDGSARVQTLAPGVNPELSRLLEDFAELTGVPVLLNTSLNTAEEPIANDAEHAIGVFRRTSIDILVLDDWILEKT